MLSGEVRFLPMDGRLEKFLDNFNQIDRDHLGLLSSMYSEDISFQDPIHEIQGLEHLRQYFTRMYKNTIRAHFEWDSRLMLGNEAMVAWRMALTHKALNGGKEFWVPGASHLKFQQSGELVTYHRDFFDTGALLYERIPGLASVVKLIKSQV
jgi:hypothetical protein